MLRRNGEWPSGIVLEICDSKGVYTFCQSKLKGLKGDMLYIVNDIINFCFRLL